MKKRVALLLLVIIIALTGVSLLSRFSRCGSEIYGLSTPAQIDLTGDGSSNFTAYLHGRKVIGDFIGMDVAIYSTEMGRYYTLGMTRWSNGHRTDNENGKYRYTVGYVEKLEDSGWSPYREIGLLNDVESGYSNKVANLIAPQGNDQEQCFPINVPLSETGTYRATLYLHSYIPKYWGKDLPFGGSSGAESYEVSFEYSVPESSPDELDVLFVDLYPNFWVEENETDSEHLAYLSFALRANGNVRHIQEDSIRFERKRMLLGYDAVECREDDAVEYDEYCFGFDDTNQVITASHIVLRGWNRSDEYHFSADFTENPDGTGERYTLQLRLKFSE